jgi:hypothetical protein
MFLNNTTAQTAWVLRIQDLSKQEDFGPGLLLLLNFTCVALLYRISLFNRHIFSLLTGAALAISSRLFIIESIFTMHGAQVETGVKHQ